VLTLGHFIEYAVRTCCVVGGQPVTCTFSSFAVVLDCVTVQMKSSHESKKGKKKSSSTTQKVNSLAALLIITDDQAFDCTEWEREP
jgi:hypothetical protein